MPENIMGEVKQYGRYGGILLLSILSILFGLTIKTIFHPNPKLVLDKYTVYGLVALWAISMVGLFIAMIFKKIPVLNKFPILGWVSIFSIIFCLPGMPFSDLIIKSINSVDLLAITTPILTYAGISVVNRMSELKQTSWKIVIVAIFVFMGTYIGSATIAQIGLMILGK
ncbi:MAG: hypothetical protein KBF12_02095 [Sebaldella sp.]|mgnify:FL=1|nr:hypothetical protein [Sebaldella sp.]